MPGLIDVQFSNGQSWSMRRSLVERQPNETETERRERVFRALFEVADFQEPEHTDPDRALPMVRSADYFMAENDQQSMLWLPLTDFVGMGLAFDGGSQLHIVGGEKLPSDRSPENCVAPVDPEIAFRIRLLTLRPQARIHAGVESALRARQIEGVDAFSAFHAFEKDGEIVTWTPVVHQLDGVSIPRVDRVTFVVSEDETHTISFEHLVMRLYPSGSTAPDVLPPRWIVSRPSPKDLEVIRELAIPD